MNKAPFILISILFFGIFKIVSAQNENFTLSAQKRAVQVFVNDKNYVEWIVSPDVSCDVLKLYDSHSKKQKVKFVSDVDSIEFTVRLGKPVDFNILYKGDTAHTRVSFFNEYPNSISMEDRLLSLSMFWSEAKYSFAFYDRLTFDWDSLYRAMIPQMLRTKNDMEYDLIMQKFAGSLQDAHTNFVGHAHRFPFIDYLGLGVKYFNDSLYVVNTNDEMSKIIPLGSKILKINNIPIDTYMDTCINPYVASSFRPTQQELAAGELFSARPLADKQTISFRTPSGEVRTVTPPRDGSKHHGTGVGTPSRTSKYAIEISWLPDKNIAVLALNTFSYEGIIKYFETNKDTLYTADGIIIDLRENRGGSTGIAKHFLQYLIKDSTYLGLGSASRLHNGVKKAQGNFIEEWHDFYAMKAYDTSRPSVNRIPDSIRRFECPVVILTSTWTVSAAEDFLIMLYERPDRPKFIGSPTFGSTGAPLVIWDWPIQNSYARICARKVLYPYSLKAFDAGIIPDIWVKPTFEEYMSGRDMDMEAAVKEIQRQLGTK